MRVASIAQVCKLNFALLMFYRYQEQYFYRKVSTWRMKEQQATRNVAEHLQERLLNGIRVNGSELPNEIIDLILRYAENHYWIAKIGMF